MIKVWWKQLYFNRLFALNSKSQMRNLLWFSMCYIFYISSKNLGYQINWWNVSGFTKISPQAKWHWFSIRMTIWTRQVYITYDLRFQNFRTSKLLLLKLHNKDLTTEIKLERFYFTWILASNFVLLKF